MNPFEDIMKEKDRKKRLDSIIKLVEKITMMFLLMKLKMENLKLSSKTKKMDSTNHLNQTV